MQKHHDGYIELRPLRRADYTRIINWVNSESGEFMAQWTGQDASYPLTVEQMEALYEGISNGFSYAVTLDGDMIGTAQLLSIDQSTKTAVLARVLIGAKEHRNKGYGSSAVREILTLAYSGLGVSTVFLRVLNSNAGAIKCYMNAGFKPVQGKSGIMGYRAGEQKGHYMAAHAGE